MKLVIYRDKKTNKICNYHEKTKSCTEDRLKAFNENPNRTTAAEIVDLDENGVAYYFYALKTRRIRDEIESLRDLESQVRDIADAIDSRLYDIERTLERGSGDE